MATSRGLFDANGPIQFSEAIKTLSTNMGDVVKSFVSMGVESTKTLEGIKQQLTAINSLSGQVSKTVGGATSKWSAAGSANTGGTGGSQGNPVGVGGIGAGAGTGAPRSQGNSAPTGTASRSGGQGQGSPMQTGTASGNPPNQPPGSMLGRGAEALLPAAGQVATDYLAKNFTGMQQAVLVGNQLSREQPGGFTQAGQNKFSRKPLGVLAQNLSDYATAASVQQTLTGVPIQNVGGLSSQQVANMPTLNQSINAMMTTNPGISRMQATQSVAGLYDTSNARTMMMMGIQLPQIGGVMSNPQKVFEQVLNAFTSGRGDSISTSEFLQLMAQNAPGFMVANKAFGGDPQLLQMFTEWGISKTSYQQKNPGKIAAGGAGQPDFLSAASLKAAGITNTSAYTGLQKGSAKASAQSQAAAGADTATQVFDRATTTFATAVDKLLGGSRGTLAGQATGFLSKLGAPLGGLAGLAGGAGGGLGGLGSMLGMATLLKAGAAGRAAAAAGSGGTGAATGAGSVAASSTEIAGGTGATVAGGSLLGAVAAPVAIGTAAGAIGLGILDRYPGGAYNQAQKATGNPNPSFAAQARQMLTNLFGSITGGAPKPASASSPTAPASSPVSGAIPGNPARNQALGQQMAAARGWVGTEWTALQKLWTKESGWDNKAENKSSGALGIPQALPPTKLPAAGQKPQLDAGAQIGWGMDYIAGRYKTPSAAWAHEVANNWYARGTWDVDRMQLAMLHKGERVIPAAENYSMAGRYSRQAQGGTTMAPSITIHSGAITVQAITLPTGQVDGQKTGAAIADGILAKLRSN